MAQLGQELIGAAAANHVVADRDPHDSRGRDVAFIARDDAGNALVHDRKHALHLVEHVIGLGISQRAQ